MGRKISPKWAFLATVAAALAITGFAALTREPPPAPPAPATARHWQALTGPWRFLGSDSLEGAEAPGFDDGSWRSVSVPHTWAGEDFSRASPKTWRRAWYRLRFQVEPAAAGLPHFLVFEGVAALADVHLNGVRLGSHLGGYTRFAFDASPALHPGENVLAVRVSNDPSDTVDSLPSGTARQLYHVYGGIYRRAWLLRTAPLHVDALDHAGPGVYATPLDVSAGSARLSVHTRVRNAGAEPRDLEVRHLLIDPEEREVLRLEGRARAAAGAVQDVALEGRVTRPRLWGPGHPHLYTVRTELRAGGSVVDTVDVRTGFRDFRLRDGRFHLNGEPVLLRGVAKHQESERSASALTDAEIREDFDNLSDLGVNLVRLAHYPHARLAYDLADERGILVWAENGHSNPHKGGPPGVRITREMVRQNYNHPSIVMWSVGNEAAFLRTQRYAKTVREEDPYRLVTYATNIDSNRRLARGLDFAARNTYLGWYAGEPWQFAEAAAKFRYIAESGGGSVVSTHTDYEDARRVVNVFEPEEYRQLLAEVHFQTVFRDRAEQIPMYVVWLLRDFAIEKYKGRNTKGLLTYSNFRKDAYYLYRSFLRPDEPLVHIASKTWFLRRGRSGTGIKVYSNRPELRLVLNGEDQGVLRNGEHRHRGGQVVENVFHWKARLRRGRNEVLATDGAGHSDTAVVYFDGRRPLPPVPGRPPLVTDLVSSNPANPAYFIDQPVRSQWPFFHDLDGTADNTFDTLPPAAEGAFWIAIRRPSAPGRATELAFSVRSPAEVLVMFTDDGAAPDRLAAAGFRDTGQAGRWRDDAMTLVPYRLLSRSAAHGDRLKVPALTTDYVVMVKPAPGGSPPEPTSP